MTTEKVTIEWSKIVTTMIVSGVGGALLMYGAQASMRTELTSTTYTVVQLSKALTEINTRLSRIEGALGVK